MNFTALTPRRWLACLAFSFGCWLAASPLTAQPAATGVVQGRVYNPATGDYVRDAEVRLEGTNLVVYTEGDGSFQFNGVPAGPATIAVSFAGYNAVKDSFNVTAGQPAVRDINLTSTTAAATATKNGVVQLSAFVVESDREGNAKAVMAQRRNMNISTSVSSDIFGDVTDGNVGEFLKYLPGVDLDYVESEARGPRLGGMDGQYVGVAFDGVRTASADANRGGGSASRATSFEGFSITAIESIEINRTSSPENDADSPAGSINMKTKRAFDRKGRTFNYNFSANLNDEEFTLSKTPGPRDHSDYKVRPNWQLGYAESFFDRKFGVLLSASHSDSYAEQIVATNGYNRSPTPLDPRPSVIRQIDFKDGPKFIKKDSLLLTADWRATPRLTLSLNLVYTYSEGEFWNRNFTFVGANDNNATTNGRSSIGGDGMLTVIAPRTTAANVASLNDGGGGAAKLTYTRQFAPRFEYKYGGWVVDGSLALSRAVNNYEAIERGFSKDEGGAVAGGWTGTRPNANSWEWTIHQNSGPDWFDLRSFTNTNTSTGGTRITNDDRTWMTEKWTGAANVQWTVPFMKKFPTQIKVGGKWDEESRNNHDHAAWSVWSYIGPGGNTLTTSPTLGTPVVATFGNWANVGPQFISPNPFELGTTNALTVSDLAGVQGVPPRPSRNAIADLFHAHPEQFVNTATPENYYTSFIANERDIRQTVTSWYGQSDTRLTAKLQIRFGARVEHTDNAVTQFDPLTRPQVLAAGYTANAPGTNNGRALTIAGLRYQYMSKPRVTSRSQSEGYFPSLLVKYQLLPNLEWQAGANRGISRPPVDNIAGLWVVDEAKLTVTAPNPDLEPEQHTSYQSRLAYYFGGRSPGQLSVAVNRNEATNFIRTQNYSASEFGVDDPAFAAYTFISSSNSTELQRYKNMEWNYSQTLGFLESQYLRGTSVNVTYARSYANQRRTGLAPHRATGRLGYTYKRFNGSFGIIWTDDKPSESTYGRFFGALTKYDLTLNLRLTRWATLYAQGRNISNVKDLWYESPPGVQEGKQAYLRQMEAYGANWVFGVKGTF